MSYQKPINPQRFDEPIYQRLQPKKKTTGIARPPKKQNKRRMTQERPTSKKSGPTTRSRTRALNKSTLRSSKMSRASSLPATRTDPFQPSTDIDTALLSSVARQLMHRRRVRTADESLRISRTNRKYLKTVNFTMRGREYAAIEQNAAKPSYWGELARQGHEVVQFKDVKTGRFVAVAVDGVVKEYRLRRSNIGSKAA